MSRSHYLGICLWLGGLTILTTTPAVSEEVLLVEQGKARATIVLAEKPRAAAQLAAFELQHYLEKVSGGQIPIIREPVKVLGTRILIGESSATRSLGYTNESFEPQEYLIKTLPNTLVLIGYDHDGLSEIDYSSYTSIYHSLPGFIGTCYSVHAFLENNLGVRWYYPNETIGEVVPRLSTVVVRDLATRRKPSVPIRTLYPLFSNTERLYFTDYDQPTRFEASWVDARQSLLYWIRNRYWGGMRYNANHSFHGYDKAFGRSHPEWFSTKSHAKMKTVPYQSAVQPCLTAAGFFEQVLAIAREYFDGRQPAYPDTNRATSGNFFPIVPNDNTLMCQCSACAALYNHEPGGEASHYVWGFVNRVARELRKSHPDAMLSSLAYFNYTLPPKGMVFEPNVAVTFCKFYQKYHDPNYQRRDYRRIAAYVNENKATFFTTYEYPIHPFMDTMPFPCLVPRVQADDVSHLRKIDGFMGGTLDRTGNTTYRNGRAAGIAWSSPVMDFMNVYWRVKLYDDFDFDIDQGLAEYYEKFFGPAAGAMGRFYSAIEDRWMTLGGASTQRGSWRKLGTAPFLNQLTELIQEAKGAARSSPRYLARVELIDAGIMKYLLKARAKYQRSALPELAPIGTAAVSYAAKPAGLDWTGDETWANAMANQIDRTIQNAKAPWPTVFKLAYDHDSLYLHVRCQEPRPKQIKALTRGRDSGGFGDDSIELFIDPANTGKTFFHFCINSLGTVYDAIVDPSGAIPDNVAWDSEIQVKTAVGNDHWELRAALPFASLLPEIPRPGTKLRFNIIRNRAAQRGVLSKTAWSAKLSGLRDPQRFGIITLNTVEDAGRLLWHCDLEGRAYKFPGESALIGVEGWYENINYANRGWSKSWRILDNDQTRFAVADLNRTNFSDLVPMHAVQVRPGRFAVEVAYRRHSLHGNMPVLRASDANGRPFGVIYAWAGRGDLIAIEQPSENPGRRNFGDAEHRLGAPAGVGKWFSLKLEIDLIETNVNGYVRSGEGPWIRLNDEPLAFYDQSARGTDVFLGLGSRKLSDADQNILEMDNIRVTQLD